MATKKLVLTGMNHAFVNTKRAAPNHVVQVLEGQTLPDDLADREADRLDDLGAFGEHPRDLRDRQIKRAEADSNGFPIPVPDSGFIGENEDLVTERELREAAEARAAAAEAELAELRAGTPPAPPAS